MCLSRIVAKTLTASRHSRRSLEEAGIRWIGSKRMTSAHTYTTGSSTRVVLISGSTRSNPVDWYPWGEEALTRARDEDKPILLSIGYSSCHWCHVMAHESFENEAIAEIMNRNFVCIKVDREERADLDAIYMEATIRMTQSGGWPMTVFLTPDGAPFFAGTYFPPVDRYGAPGLPQVARGDRDLVS